jgi:hypothetical protein
MNLIVKLYYKIQLLIKISVMEISFSYRVMSKYFNLPAHRLLMIVKIRNLCVDHYSRDRCAFSP